MSSFVPRNACCVGVSFKQALREQQIPMGLSSTDRFVPDEIVTTAHGGSPGFSMASTYLGIPSSHEGLKLQREFLYLASANGYDFAERGSTMTLGMIDQHRFVNFNRLARCGLHLLRQHLIKEAADGVLLLPLDLKDYPRISLDGLNGPSVLRLSTEYKEARASLARFAFDRLGAHAARIPSSESGNRISRIFVNPIHSSEVFIMDRV